MLEEKTKSLIRGVKKHKISFEGLHLWATLGENKMFVQSALCIGCKWLLQIWKGLSLGKLLLL